MGNSRTHLSAPTAVADVDRFVVIGDGAMKVGDYTLTATLTMPEAGTARHVTITHAAVGAADTLGTVTITGKGIGGQPLVEVLTPTSGGLATSVGWFASVSKITGAGWVIAEGNDTITVGCAADAIVAEGGGTLHGVAVNTTAAGAITLADAGGTIAVLKASIVENLYLYDVNWSGYLKVALAAASDITVLHSGSLPTSYAM